MPTLEQWQEYARNRPGIGARPPIRPAAPTEPQETFSTGLEASPVNNLFRVARSSGDPFPSTNRSWNGLSELLKPLPTDPKSPTATTPANASSSSNANTSPSSKGPPDPFYSLGTSPLPPASFPPPAPTGLQAVTGLEGVEALQQAIRNNPQGTLIDAWAGGGQPYAPIFAGDSRLTGMGIPAQPMQPGINGDYRTVGQQQGQQAVPLYQTDYRDGQGNVIASIAGPNQRVGGGTVSAPDQGNGGTVEGNVAAINRQIEALRSLREARNPGITTGAVAASAPMPSFSPFDRPGDGRGDREMRQNRYDSMLEEAMTGRGLSRGRRQALLNGAQGLLAPGLASMQQQGESFRTLANIRPPSPSGVSPYEAARLGIDQQNMNLEQSRWQAEQDRAARTEAFDRHKWATEKELDWRKSNLPKQASRQESLLGDLGASLVSAQQVMLGNDLTPEQRQNAQQRYESLANLYRTLTGKETNPWESMEK